MKEFFFNHALILVPIVTMAGAFLGVWFTLQRTKPVFHMFLALCSTVVGFCYMIVYYSVCASIGYYVGDSWHQNGIALIRDIAEFPLWQTIFVIMASILTVLFTFCTDELVSALKYWFSKAFHTPTQLVA